MILNKLKQLSILIAALAGLTVKAQETSQRTSKPNFVFIMPDQWRGQALGFLGIEPVMTPHLDALAKESHVFTQAIANYPVCSPSRAMMMTGQLPLENGVWSNVNSATAPYGIELAPDKICWSNLLKEAGYTNAWIGKWHLDSPHEPYVPTYNNKGKVAWNEWTPPDRRPGFDFWYAYGTYDRHLRPMYWDTHAKRDEFKYVDQWGPEHEVDKALEFIGQLDGKTPFSVTLSINPPHSVYSHVPDKYLAMYKDLPVAELAKQPGIPAADTEMGKLYRNTIQQYYAAITGVDEQIGRLVKGLEDKGLMENTVLIFLSDHGNCLGRNGEHAKNNHFEESLRIPAMVYWKNRIKPNIDNKSLFSLLDLYPTILGLLGVEDTQSVPGTDFTDLLVHGKPVDVKHQFFMGRINPRNKSGGFRGIRTATYKLAYVKNRPVDKSQVYLYNVANDPYDQQNIADTHPEVVKELTKELKVWLKKANDPFLSDI